MASAARRRPPARVRRAARARRLGRQRAVAAVLAYLGGLEAIAALLWGAFAVPDAGGLLALVALGFGLGAAGGRFRACALAVLVVPVGVQVTGTLVGGLVAFLTVGPAAVTGLALGAAWRRADRRPARAHATATGTERRAAPTEAPGAGRSLARRLAAPS